MPPQDTTSIDAYVAQLPPALREYLQSREYTDALAASAATLGLTAEQADAYGTEVYLVLIGLELRENLPNNIIRACALPVDTAAKLADLTNTHVFERAVGNAVSATPPTTTPARVGTDPYHEPVA